MTLVELLELLKKHVVLVIALPVACAVVMALYSVLGMSDTYTASTSMYILAKSSEESTTTNYSDLSASQMLSNDVATLLESDAVETSAAKKLGLENLKDYSVSVESQTTTRVITLSVTGKDPSQTAAVANAMAESVSDVAQQVEAAQSINVIDSAKVPEKPSGPKRGLYVAVAFLAGLFMAVALLVLQDVLNTRVRDVDDVENLLGAPVIGRIPFSEGGGIR